MKTDYLHKIENVSVPESLLEGIKNKIETKRVTDRRNGNYALLFALILLLANVGLISSYNSNENSKNRANQEANPYSFNQSFFIEYD